jgi:hypothetical protein
MVYRYQCSVCEKWHDGFPVIAVDRPLPAEGLPPSTKLRLTSDLCVIDDASFFIRVQLLLPVAGTDDTLGFSVWSSLSEANFRRYEQHYDRDMSGWPSMFGYLSNELPGYEPSTLGLKLAVQPIGDRLRPLAELEPTNHQLSLDQRNGLPLERALDLVRPLNHSQ